MPGPGRWKRIAVVLAWAGAAALLLPQARGIEQHLDVAARAPGSESERVERLLVERFGSPFAHYAVLVVGGVPGPGTPAGSEALSRIRDVVAATPGVQRTFSYIDTPDPLFDADGAGTFLIVGLDAGDRGADALIPELRAALRPLTAALRGAFPDATLRMTGEAALNHDLRATSAAEAERAEARVLPLTLLLLLLVFGALTAAALPLFAGALTIPLALGIAALLTMRWPLSVLLVNVVTMIGLGLGIDYALLVVSRFREALGAGEPPAVAARTARREAGHTVVVSGLAVAIGFGALLVVPVNELRSVAIGGLLVALLSVLLMTTLLPVVLAWLGTRVDAGSWRGWRGLGDANRDRWLRWGRWVAAHPKRVLLVAGLPVLLLLLPAARLSTELPRGDWLPSDMESAQALAQLQHMGRSSIIQTVRVVLELPANATLWDERGWAATSRLGAALLDEPAVARVRSLPVLAAGAPPALAFQMLPPEVRRSFSSDDGRHVLLELLPVEDAQPVALSRLVERLRAADAESSTGVAGARVLVGGLPAFNVDYEAAVAGRFWRVVAMVVIGTFIGLGVGFRSVLVPLKAIALNLLSVGAAFGAVVLAFQDGMLGGLFGLDSATGGVFPIVPVLVFCTVFGLSMDYEVFLVARVREAKRRGLNDGEAVAEGLAGSAGIITGAAAIMIVVFGAFTLGDFLLVHMLGLALATAVLIDATLVRMALGPALLVLAGRWNWWPGERTTRAQAERGRGADPLEPIGLESRRSA